MAERGKARSTLISAGSNTTVKTGAGTLYGVQISPANGASVRIEDATDLGAAPNLNTQGTATIARVGTYADAAPAYIDFGPGVGFNAGLTVAASSNARLSVIWE